MKRLELLIPFRWKASETLPAFKPEKTCNSVLSGEYIFINLNHIFDAKLLQNIEKINLQNVYKFQKQVKKQTNPKIQKTKAKMKVKMTKRKKNNAR